MATIDTRKKRTKIQECQRCKIWKKDYEEAISYIAELEDDLIKAEKTIWEKVKEVVRTIFGGW